SFSPSPIPVEDSDSLMEEIDLSFTLDYLMPPCIEDDDYDSERDILILKYLPSNDTLSIPEIESFHFDIPSFSRPPAKPPDGDTGILNVKMMGDIFDQKVPMPKLMITFASNQEKIPRNLKTLAQGFCTQVFISSASIGNHENVAEDVAHDAIPSPPSKYIPSPSQEQSSPPQQPQSSPQAPPQDERIELVVDQVKDADIAKTEGR
nr:hypothetical protein [Tanacetum cinerariifolium]